MYFYNTGGQMPQWLAEARFKAANNQDKLSQYGYRYGGLTKMQTAGSYMGQMGPISNPFGGAPREQDFDDPYMYQQAMDEWMSSLPMSNPAPFTLPRASTSIQPPQQVASQTAGFPSNWTSQVPAEQVAYGPNAAGTGYISPLSPAAAPAMGPTGAAQVAAPMTALAPYEGESIYDFMVAQKKAPDLVSRKQLAKMIGIPNYTGTPTQNRQMMEKIRQNPTILSSYNVTQQPKTKQSDNQKVTQLVKDLSRDSDPLSASPAEVEQVAKEMNVSPQVVQQTIDTLKAAGVDSLSSGIPTIDSATAAALATDSVAVGDTTGLGLGSLDLPANSTTGLLNPADSNRMIELLQKAKKNDKVRRDEWTTGKTIGTALIGYLGYQMYKRLYSAEDKAAVKESLKKIVPKLPEKFFDKLTNNPQLLAKMQDADALLQQKSFEKGIEWTDYITDLWKQGVKSDDVKLFKQLAKEAGVEWTSLLEDADIQTILKDQETRNAIKTDKEVRALLDATADETDDAVEELLKIKKANTKQAASPASKSTKSIMQSMSPTLKAKLTRAAGKLRGSALGKSADLAKEVADWYSSLSPRERKILQTLDQAEIENVWADRTGALGSRFNDAWRANQFAEAEAARLAELGVVDDEAAALRPRAGQPLSNFMSRVGSKGRSAARAGLEALESTPWLKKAIDLGRRVRFEDGGELEEYQGAGERGLYDPLSGMTEYLTPDQYAQAYNQGDVGWWQSYDPTTKKWVRVNRNNLDKYPNAEFVSSTKELPGVTFTSLPSATLKKMADEDAFLRNRVADSRAENILEFVDPTGISSWDDIADVYANPNASALDKAFTTFSAVPFLGKFGKAAKGAKASTKLGRLGQKAMTGLDWVSGTALQRHIDAANPLVRFTSDASGNLLSSLPKGFTVGANLAGDINKAERFWKGVGTAGLALPKWTDQDYAVNLQMPDGTTMQTSTMSPTFAQLEKSGLLGGYDSTSNTIKVKYKDGGDYSGTYSAGVYYRNGGIYAYQNGGESSDRFGGTYIPAPSDQMMMPNYYGGGKMKKGGSINPRLGDEMDLSEQEIRRLQSMGYEIEYV
jgi:hypothetical protein